MDLEHLVMPSKASSTFLAVPGNCCGFRLGVPSNCLSMRDIRLMLRVMDLRTHTTKNWSRDLVHVHFRSSQYHAVCEMTVRLPRRSSVLGELFLQEIRRGGKALTFKLFKQQPKGILVYYQSPWLVIPNQSCSSMLLFHREPQFRDLRITKQTVAFRPGLHLQQATSKSSFLRHYVSVDEKGLVYKSCLGKSSVALHARRVNHSVHSPSEMKWEIRAYSGHARGDACVPIYVMGDELMRHNIRVLLGWDESTFQECQRLCCLVNLHRHSMLLRDIPQLKVIFGVQSTPPPGSHTRVPAAVVAALSLTGRNLTNTSTKTSTRASTRPPTHPSVTPSAAPSTGTPTRTPTRPSIKPSRGTPTGRTRSKRERRENPTSSSEPHHDPSNRPRKRMRKHPGKNRRDMARTHPQRYQRLVTQCAQAFLKDSTIGMKFPRGVHRRLFLRDIKREKARLRNMKSAESVQ